METLIKITQNEQGSQVVSARELHTFLEVGKDFSTWIKGRIEKYNFIERIDYEVISPKFGESDYQALNDTLELTEDETWAVGRPQIIYAITLDMAKELAMIENNKKGEQARRYFIECEKKLKEVVQQPLLPQDYLSALKALVASTEENIRMQEQLALQAPKVEAWDKIVASDALVDIGQAAKLLDLGYGRNTLFKVLKEKGVFFANRNEPKQEYVDRGYFKVKEIDNEYVGVLIKVYVTQKGLEWLAVKLKETQTFVPLTNVPDELTDTLNDLFN